MTDTPTVHIRAFEHEHIITIVAINSENQPKVFQAKMPHLKYTGHASLPFEQDRQVQISNGVLQDIIDGYGMRTYPYPSTCHSLHLADTDFTRSIY
jgi:hypothetical protein